MNAKLAPVVHGVEPPNLLRSDPTEYIVFVLDGQKFGFDLGYLVRIQSYRTLTRIANGPEFFDGVAISDGAIIPIVDMRIAACGKTPTFDIFTTVIIVNIAGHKLGLIVDGVMDVVGLAAEDVNPPSVRGASIAPAADFVIGVATHSGRRLILLDIGKLFPDSSFNPAATDNAAKGLESVPISNRITSVIDSRKSRS